MIVKRLIIGSIAGLAGTVLMTIVMECMHRRLPKRERYPLPPREITMALAQHAGIKPRLGEGQRYRLTLVAHYGYGAVAGAFYLPFMQKVPLPPVVKGFGYGLTVWIVSYLGWVSATGILAPATRFPPRRNVLMIVAHLVWGGTLASLAERIWRTQIRGGILSLLRTRTL